MATGRYGEHVRGRGPSPVIPSAKQTTEAAERLLKYILEVAQSDDELAGIPGEDDIAGLLRYDSILRRRHRDVPPDQVLRDRAAITSYLRDRLDWEDLQTLTEMNRAKMPDSRQSAAFGYEHRTAAYKKRLSLERKFSSGFKTPTGELRRAPRTKSARASTAMKQRTQEEWIMNNEKHFERVVEQFLGAGASLGVSAGSIEDLQDELEEARRVSGDWAGVVPYLRIAVQEAGEASDSAASKPLVAAKTLLQNLDQRTETSGSHQ